MSKSNMTILKPENYTKELYFVKLAQTRTRKQDGKLYPTN